MSTAAIHVIGRVATTPEGRRLGDGQTMAKFRLATTERRFEADSGQWVDGESLFITVVCWRRLAERVLLDLEKGDPVLVAGKLRYREYEVDKQKRSAYELDAASVGPDLARCAITMRRPKRDQDAGGHNTQEAATDTGGGAVQPAAGPTGGPTQSDTEPLESAA